MRYLPLLLLVAACKSAPKESSWLFVQNAERVQLKAGQLTLTDVDPHLVCFTDRPERRTGTVPLGKFVTGWTDGGVFADDPPNATLAIFGDDKVEEAVVVLRNPKVDGRTLTYDVTLLEGTVQGSGPAALFIDNVGSGAPILRHGMHREPGVILRSNSKVIR